MHIHKTLSLETLVDLVFTLIIFKYCSIQGFHGYCAVLALQHASSHATPPQLTPAAAAAAHQQQQQRHATSARGAKGARGAILQRPAFAGHAS